MGHFSPGAAPSRPFRLKPKQKASAKAKAKAKADPQQKSAQNPNRVTEGGDFEVADKVILVLVIPERQIQNKLDQGLPIKR